MLVNTKPTNISIPRTSYPIHAAFIGLHLEDRLDPLAPIYNAAFNVRRPFITGVIFSKTRALYTYPFLQLPY